MSELTIPAAFSCGMRETLTALRPAYLRLRAAEWPACMVPRGITTGGSMCKLMLFSAGLVALLATSVAVAHGIEGAKTAKAVAGTFTAATSNVSTRTCTTSDGKAIVVTNGKYTAVYDHGTIAGLSVGRAHEPSARLVANLSATFAAATGFTGGKLGGGTASGSAVELGSGACKASHTKPEKSQARGTISALSSSSITVAGLTCAVPADKSAQVTAKFKTGERAEIHCALTGSENTLTRIEKR